MTDSPRGQASCFLDGLLPRGSILELGHVGYLSHVLPDLVRWIAIGSSDPLPSAALVLAGPAAPRQLPRFLHLISQPHLQLVVCRIHHHPGRVWQLAVRLLLRFCRVPIIVLDFEDEDIVHPAHRPLLAASHRLFKRELPLDRWRLARPFPIASVQEDRLRRDAQALDLVRKLRPLPLGLPLGLPPPPPSVPRSHDLYFAGTGVDVPGHRQAGFAELAGLASEGLRLDLPSGRLSRLDHLGHCSAAWLTWSPPGYGWQCFRHAEAALCGSVPLLSYPTVETHAGFVDGRQALFYDPRPGGLTLAVRRALADTARLRILGEAAREHVLTHHTPEAIAAYILGDALGD
ncbi:glycosyltransferase [Cyanobium gracile]|uniref:Glycosyltransferase n=1 Tax=Cyanobium gracile UHCC 0281 TaxID=3110309 RepID=A0ABU5SR34_9CYAN|nr:glycosyltransferase [Cyanobium gracile]MEA5440935.1 glycosyltransferase [Cyanobium gracile UHCC 0281]